MHIGFFSDGFIPQLNGVATSLELLATALEVQGHSVSLFVPAMGDYVDQLPRVYRIPSFLALKEPPLWVATPLSRRVFAQIPELGLEVVHVHTPFMLQFLGLQVARRTGLPLVSTYHTLLPAHVNTVKLFGRYAFPPRLAELYSAWSSNICDHIVAPSEKVKVLLEKYGVCRPISVIYNGIMAERFQGNQRGYLRSRFGLLARDKILLFVGRLTPDKNIAFLIDVLARLAKRDETIYLALVGRGYLKDEFEARAARLGVGRNLLFCGTLAPEEMPQVYADADIFITASLSEVHSIAALEALASGLPLVVPCDLSFASMVAQGQNGFALELDADLYAARVRDILGNPTVAQQMRACSRARASAFSVAVQVEKLLNVYGDLLVEKKHRLPQGSTRAI